MDRAYSRVCDANMCYQFRFSFEDIVVFSGKTNFSFFSCVLVNFSHVPSLSWNTLVEFFCLFFSESQMCSEGVFSHRCDFLSNRCLGIAISMLFSGFTRKEATGQYVACFIAHQHRCVWRVCKTLCFCLRIFVCWIFWCTIAWWNMCDGLFNSTYVGVIWIWVALC